jgi:hypothetical protein
MEGVTQRIISGESLRAAVIALFFLKKWLS